MSKTPIKHLIAARTGFNRGLRLFDKGETYTRHAYNVLKRFHWSKADDDDDDSSKGKSAHDNKLARDSGVSNYDGLSKWKPEIAWLGKALEPALQFYKWAVPSGNEDGNGNKIPPTDRSLAEIFASIQKSKLGIKDWTLSDLTVGLYLIYLRQASTNPLEELKGESISSEPIIHDLIYHIELAKGAYKDNATSLDRHSMLRENNIVKFIKHSSVLRPGYYIGVDKRKKLVIFGIRGTHTAYDLITDIISSSHEEVTSEGYSTHFGTAEAARWFLTYEMDTIRKCLEQHKGFRLRFVGHSLGGAIASLLAIMLREKSVKDLGFSPDIVTAVGYGTPPCVSKEVAESCLSFVTTVVMQDDIIPRLSVASLTRLRNEIVETDWDSAFKREDWKGVIDLVTNAKQVVSSVQDVARKLTDYAKFTRQKKYAELPRREDMVPTFSRSSNHSSMSSELVEPNTSESRVPEDLFVPGTLYYLKRNVDAKSHYRHREYFTLVKRQPGEHLQRILLSNNIISDHKCDSHLYALRDVLKGLPGSLDEKIFAE